MKTYRFHITGKVQGVWYRASAKDQALALGLKGKVWNQPDGSVGILVQGPDDVVMTYIEWCRQGPMLAEVNEVVVHEEVQSQTYSGFEITRS